MRFVGIDPAASKGIALVSVGEAKSAIVHTSPVFKVSEAQRLVAIRRWVNHHTPKSSVCVLVEQQYMGKILPAIGAVCVEGAQAAAPGAVVIEMMPSSWRKALSGSGKMSKDEAMNVAEEYGVPRQDDLAEALCLALVARKRWREATDRFA
jgi:Holliday junction resolvasome RuvABC endonuclease subunit